ncbi:rubredoxin-like domain-containing protein [Desulfogranum mediterraneum]|uniref:rubredoxin-like domain-containing protein n=1 Tax=Desulfogranum mediterraneum TaxID=160661 RepID=UPI00041058DC|nr:DUF2231 domain-containing protein [Desulfogranum mediterraneum]
MKQWECTVCGYIHEGELPPEECPVCGAGAEMFVEVNAAAAEPAETVPAPEPTPQPGRAEAAAQAPAPDSAPERISSLILRFHLHPIAVHSPNGIVPLAVLLLFLCFLFGTSSLESAAFYNLLFVLVMMPAVLLTGYLTWKKKYQGKLTSLFQVKIGASLLSLSLLLVLVAWRILQPQIMTSASGARILYLALSLLLLGAIGTAGHLGGKLVFGGKK